MGFDSVYTKREWEKERMEEAESENRQSEEDEGGCGEK